MTANRSVVQLMENAPVIHLVHARMLQVIAHVKMNASATKYQAAKKFAKKAVVISLHVHQETVQARANLSAK